MAVILLGSMGIVRKIAINIFYLGIKMFIRICM